MDTTHGRHRRRGVRGLAITAILIALCGGFLAGMGTDRYLLVGADDDEASAAAPSTSAPSTTTAPRSGSPRTQALEATGSPAAADPAPPGPQGAEAYLARLADSGLPVEQHRDVILVLGRMVCEATPSERADYEATADRVAALAPELLSQQQTLLLVQLAAQELCAA